MGSGAAYASASRLPSFLAYIYPSLGVMLLLFVAATTYFAIGVSQTIVDAIRLRFENIDLSGAERAEIMARLSAAINADQVHVDFSRRVP
jgi:hypothetical protein